MFGKTRHKFGITQGLPYPGREPYGIVAERDTRFPHFAVAEHALAGDYPFTIYHLPSEQIASRAKTRRMAWAIVAALEGIGAGAELIVPDRQWLKQAAEIVAVMEPMEKE